ncbi:hypothetical protein [Candidatus Mycoplasma haematohominis]|uniref:Uncharacterized protein n=1 Tax=Candidatus Mycoplasma haematohominis TaxID=1494318 RepID=A0A478FTJ1_9MOLU|nr:hypothetical protein [Candidatus Mycoplasma haemohominis]GCE63415.1 hypothetical protein MHSWG343_04120 [Candidatus Mycoplasma haemohominis]
MGLFWNKQIRVGKRLRKEGFKLVKRVFNQDKVWEEIAEVYRKQEHNPKFIKTENRLVDRYISIKLKKKSRKILKIKCDDVSNEVYIQAKKWCVVPHRIKERAKKLGFSFLNMEENSDEDHEIWEMRIVNYRFFKGEINLENIIGSTSIFKYDNSILERKISIVKKTAKEIINKMNYDEDSEEAWNTMVRWFVKERP